MVWIESVSNSQPYFFLNILEVQVLRFTYRKIKESSESYTEVTWSDGGAGVGAILGQNGLNQVRISTKKSHKFPCYLTALLRLPINCPTNSSYK